MRLVTVSALSHDGLLRDHNEDSLVVGAWTTCAATTQTPATLVFPLDPPVVVAVADGLGGHPAGEVASTLVVQELARAARTLTGEEQVQDAVRRCNDVVYDAAEHDPDRAGMATTVAGVVLSEERAVVFNVGDSRVYDATEGFAQVSVDDSPPLPPGQTHTSVITRTIGGMARLRPVTAHTASQPLTDTSRFLVCSDGLTDVVADDDLAAILAEHHGPQAAVELWRAAMEAGGPDNITLALVEVAAD